MQATVRISQGVVRMPQWRMAEPVDFELLRDEQMAIIGPNGGGKSLLADIITGKHPLLITDPEYNFGPNDSSSVSDNVRQITFRDCYGTDNDRTYYLQQRWNQQEIGDETPTMGFQLEKAFLLTGPDTMERRCLQQTLYKRFDIEYLLPQPIILLSSGELRKFQIIQALFSSPRLLILDNPFIGLDEATRNELRLLLEEIISDGALQVVLLLSRAEDIPDFITHVVEVRDRKVGRKQTREDYLATYTPRYETPEVSDGLENILTLPLSHSDKESDRVVCLNDVSIRYGNRTLLSHLNWTVRKGEHWSLTGPNGSGKSTLLSLICADNPQGYACDIELFGTPRGTGESIWDIKRRIGYVSPEMHRAYKRNLPAIRIVASGLSDSIGLYVKPSEKDYEVCRLWLQIFGIGSMAERDFLTLSSGEQRLVLLARAFVKDPELLILDEPFHGLDTSNRLMVRKIIDTFCHRRGKTLIMVSHYQDDMPSCVDHYLKLERNKQ